MRTHTQPLIDLLNSGEFVYADAYKIELRNGTVLRYTNADIDIQADSNTYLANQLLINGARFRSVRGLETDDMDLRLIPQPGMAINGISFPHALRKGLFDRAQVEVRRVFLPDWKSAVTGEVIFFQGEMSSFEPTGTGTSVTVQAETHLLNVEMPRIKYAVACTHTFGDAGCGFDKSSTQESSSVLGGSSDVRLLCGLAQADGHWNLGTVTMTSGKNTGLKRTVNFDLTGDLRLLSPLPFDPEVGDTFTVTQGCKRSYAACQGYSNTARYRGFPNIPVPETAV